MNKVIDVLVVGAGDRAISSAVCACNSMRRDVIFSIGESRPFLAGLRSMACWINMESLFIKEE